MTLRVKWSGRREAKEAILLPALFPEQSFRNSQVWSGQAGHHLNIVHADKRNSLQCLYLQISYKEEAVKNAPCSSCREMQISVWGMFYQLYEENVSRRKILINEVKIAEIIHSPQALILDFTSGNIKSS